MSSPSRPLAVAVLLTCLTLHSVPRASAAASDAPAAVTGEIAARAFDRLKTLEGTWVGKSTKGWEERVQYRVIAKQSCLMETSFDAHPNEEMVTMICPDGDRLLLTHYCVAMNQPRLVLTSAAPDLSQMTFEFLDGTNLPSRDEGHMDKVIFKFAGADEFTSQWTWYQDGKENWMEEIRSTRVKDGEAPAAVMPAAGG
ncbi:MAG: hypothetical protein U0167_07270 [bacterium]